MRAGELGLPLAIANISVPPAKLAPLAALYRRTGIQAGHASAANALKVSIATHMHIKENSQDALNAFSTDYAGYFFTHTPSHWRAVEVTRQIMMNALPRMARFSSAVRSKSSTRSCMSGSFSATSVSWRKSTSAACHFWKLPA